MWRLGLEIDVLVLLLVLSFAFHLEASRSKRQGGFVFDTSSGKNGKKCTTKDSGKEGVCIPFDKCDEATKIFGPGNNPSREQRLFLQQRTCKFEGPTPFFCCVASPTAGPAPSPTARPPPPTPRPTLHRMTESDLNKVCGKALPKTTNIVGGQPAQLGAWPWMAAIFTNQPLSFVSCGGVLISEQYVLTAAHCIIDQATGQKSKISDYTIRLGELVINDDKDGATPIDLLAAELIPHEHYTTATTGNDIALIKLDRSVSFTDLISPICLPSASPMSNDLYLGRQPFVAGWGTVEFRGESSSELRQVMLHVKNNNECQTAFNQFNVTIKNTQLCAGISLGGKDACQGDSGGPLMLRDTDNKCFTIGIVSLGFRCAEPGFPGIYTRTTSYIDWIKKNANIL